MSTDKHGAVNRLSPELVGKSGSRVIWMPAINGLVAKKWIPVWSCLRFAVLVMRPHDLEVGLYHWSMAAVISSWAV